MHVFYVFMCTRMYVFLCLCVYTHVVGMGEYMYVDMYEGEDMYM